MAKYMAKTQGYIDMVLRQPGEVFDYEGKMPGRWMMLIEDEAEEEKPKASAKTPSAKEEKAKAKSSRASDQSVI